MELKFYERCTSGCEYRNKCLIYSSVDQEISRDYPEIIPLVEKFRTRCETGVEENFKYCGTRKVYIQQDEETSQLAKYFAEHFIEEKFRLSQ